MAEPKKGKALLMMFGKPKGDGSPDGDGKPMGGDGGEYDDFRSACDEAFDAFQKGDKAGFCEAFRSAMDIHESSEDDGEGEEEEPEGGEAA